MIFLLVVLVLVISVFIFLQQPQFGKLPAGKYLEKMKSSSNYRDGKFQNRSHTPSLSEGTTYWAVIKEFFFEKKENKKPPSVLPSKKIDLLNLDPDKNILVWFGHSSYFMQVDGKKILVDPVLSGFASPLKFTTRSFPGTDTYKAEDIPAIDYLFISHDHWDHLDYNTIKKIKPGVGKIICGLGVTPHFKRWGFTENIIVEKDWGEKEILDEGFEVAFTSARHFSGRGFKRDQSIWSSYVFKTPSLKIFIGGDSGYDFHFVEIGKNFGPFDLAILECGQYDKSWKYIHMMPEQTAQAAIELNAKKLMPVHWAKFSLGNHAWDDSIKRVSAASKEKNISLITPMIGEEVDLKNTSHEFVEWWIDIK
jgi:L-ascorbate metabolism protein UlaG (beta-lactamase superfamily)